MSQKQKTAIVTGSSSGIGLDVARLFLERGFDVVLNGRDAKKLDAAMQSLARPYKTTAVVGDIADPRTGTALVATALERFGSVDVLVNNAGIFAPKPFLAVTPEELDSFLTGNLRGTYLVSQSVVRQMKSEGGGSIVNIGTVLVDHAVTGLPCSAPIASKGGIHALTVSLAAELAPLGIRVNMVAPGIIRTPLHGAADVDSFGGIALLDRVGEGREIAEAVLHLVEAEFTTGLIMPVDGGFVAGRR